jgi:hypothetical protein
MIMKNIRAVFTGVVFRMVCIFLVTIGSIIQFLISLVNRNELKIKDPEVKLLITENIATINGIIQLTAAGLLLFSYLWIAVRHFSKKSIAKTA